MKSDQFAKDINYQKLIFLHLNRTGISIIEAPLFIANVEFMEILMSPYMDDDYKADMKSKQQKASAIATLDPLMQKDDMAQQAAIKKAVHNLRCLMSLAERKGLLLEKVDADEEWDLPEDDDNANTEDDN